MKRRQADRPINDAEPVGGEYGRRTAGWCCARAAALLREVVREPKPTACSSGTVSRVLPLYVRRRLFFVDVAWRIHWRRSRLRGTHARESGFVITGWVDVDGICAKSVCDHGMIGYGFVWIWYGNSRRGEWRCIFFFAEGMDV